MANVENDTLCNLVKPMEYIYSVERLIGNDSGCRVLYGTTHVHSKALRMFEDSCRDKKCQPGDKMVLTASKVTDPEVIEYFQF